MAAVDLVVSRAGAITLAEVCAAGRPSVLLPLLAGGAHQLANARLLCEAGAASLIEDDLLDADRLRLELTNLLGDRARLARMGENARSLARPRAADGDRRPDRGAVAAAREGRLMFHRFAGLRHAHFVGIGGAGMSGIAEVLLQYEVTVSGCDQSASEATERLCQLGVAIATGHSADHLEGVDLLVISSAIAAGNPEVLEAQRGAASPSSAGPRCSPS